MKADKCLRNSVQGDSIVRPPTLLTVVSVAADTFHKGNAMAPVACSLLTVVGDDESDELLECPCLH